MPSRFGADREWGERAARPLRLVAGRDARPTADELATLRDGLMRRDETAAALVKAVRTKDLHRALAAGTDADVPQPVRDFFDTVRNRPSWVDDRLLARGASACRAFGMDAGLVLAYGS